jgi:hypothetical protein
LSYSNSWFLSNLITLYLEYEIGEWSKLHVEELHNFFSPNIVRPVILRLDEACITHENNILVRIYHGVDGSIILKLISTVYLPTLFQ